MRKTKEGIIAIEVDKIDKRKAIFKIKEVWEKIEKLGSEDFEKAVKLMLQEHLLNAYSVSIGIGSIELLNMDPWNDKDINIVKTGIETILAK